jgi:Holliday junction resolvase RusA-like endonuclease
VQKTITSKEFRELLFTVVGEPKAKARPKFYRSPKGFVGTYTPKDTVSYENHVKASFVEKYHNFTPFSGPCQMVIMAYWPVPKSIPKKHRDLFESGDMFRSKKPDWDNIGKSVCDALNGVAYQDDSQIVHMRIEKRYSPRPRVDVMIVLLGEEMGV